MPRSPADELLFTVTRDGWRIALHRYRPTAGPKRRHTVVCCHGLGANHLTFDVARHASLAHHLASRGYQVLVLDLRGHGASEMPRRRGPKRFGWSFDDYLQADLPAAMGVAGELGEERPVHWIGHSMGGLLLYAHLAQGGSGDVRSAVTVASSLDYSGSGSGFRRLMPLRGVLGVLPRVPVRGIARGASLAVGRRSTTYERFNVWPSNTDARLWRRLSAEGFHDVSPPVMAQLASALESGGLRSRDRRVRYKQRLAEATAPVLSIAGSRDMQCPPAAARRTLEALGSARRELRVFGRQQGHADDYGHFDLLIGRRVKHEVYPAIDAWLDEHD
jgi:alpha-beta hydrolase superfamily lysophospholipase